MWVCRWEEKKTASDAIFIPRTIIKSSIEVNKDLYMCIIDYTETFYRLRYEDVIQMLEKLHRDDEDKKIIKNMCWNQKSSSKSEQ